MTYRKKLQTIRTLSLAYIVNDWRGFLIKINRINIFANNITARCIVFSRRILTKHKTKKQRIPNLLLARVGVELNCFDFIEVALYHYELQYVCQSISTRCHHTFKLVTIELPMIKSLFYSVYINNILK